MRLRLAFAAAQSMGLFLASEAFTPACWRRTSPARSLPVLRHDTFEDDDFLDSLKGKTPAGEGDELSDDIDDAELSDEMKDKLKKEDETFGGGSRFKEMMAKAQSKAPSATGPSTIKNPFAENPFAGIEGLDPEASPAEPAPQQPADPAAALAADGAFDNMTTEQQAQMFRAMMQGQQVNSNSPPPAERVKSEGQKVGRNRDADTIQNTADVYFAQLKRDSTVRGIARLRGEDDKANAVFKDERIEELNNLISENPHLAGKREEEQNLITAAAEEMLAFQQANEIKPSDMASTGVSYKEKLAQRRNKARRAPSAAAVPVTPPEPPAPPKVEEPAAQVTPPAPKVEEPAAVVPPKVEEPVVAAAPVVAPAALEPPAIEQPKPRTPEEPAAAAPAAPKQSTPSVSASSSPDEIRNGIRTLMGLILKHRGGAGFGTGGLKGDAIGQYEQLMNEMTALLKDEAQTHHTGPTAAVAQATSVAAPAAVLQAPAPTEAVESSEPSAPAGLSEVESMLACIDGAILMYRNSPAELKESVLMTVRAALLSAVNTCNKVVGQNEGIPSTAGAGANVESMLACVTGAIQMYRNSPPELQQTVLLTVRAALLSAVGTCNKIVAENEVQNVQDYKEATADKDLPEPTPKPVQFYDVAATAAPEEPQPVEEPQVAESAPVGTDANSVVLEKIYNKMKAASGNGKLGLREDLTSGEAADLADSIAEMRSIMMNELDNGIPERASETPVAARQASAQDSSPSDSASTTSIYAKMLAKARADKAARG